MKKKNLFLFLPAIVFFLFSFSANAQSAPVISDMMGKFEVGVTFGGNNFLGDLGGNIGKGGPFLKDYTFKTIRPLVGASLAYYPQNWYQIKFGFNYTSVDGADSLIPPTDDLARWRIYRNLSFNSHIFEAYVKGQFYPFTYFDPAYTVHRLSPFLEFGVGVFTFNPTTQYKGATVELRPLDLEGQSFTEYPDRKQFTLTQIYLPAAIGFKYYVNDFFSVSGGMEFRLTFTDYIDGISTTYIDPALFTKYLTPAQATLATNLYQRSLRPEKVRPDILKANPDNNDTYATIFVTLSLTMQRMRNFWYGGHDRSRDGMIIK